MSINELQDNVIEEFADFDDWMDKYALLIDLGFPLWRKSIKRRAT